ncbi:MAG: hypothetical protein ACD_45C00175G0004 [uncultured bacterium]|nr:MAG: hypothetical protein ACD_45C00175G0004 [uncultured bacterium]
MSRNKTAEELKQHHIQIMGEKIGSHYHALWNELAQLYSKWDEYVELFGTKPSRLELLNSSAPLFFRTVQDSLWESTLIHITRITDPVKSCGKDNLSITRLECLVDVEIKGIISEKINIAVKKSNFCRDWRNRRIAHNDLSLALDSGAVPLEPASRASIKDALQSIASVLNTVEEHYMNSTTEFNVIKGFYGAEALLYVLDDGLTASKERKKRIAARTYTPDDLKHRDL